MLDEEIILLLFYASEEKGYKGIPNKDIGNLIFILGFQYQLFDSFYYEFNGTYDSQGLFNLSSNLLNVKILQELEKKGRLIQKLDPTNIWMMNINNANISLLAKEKKNLIEQYNRFYPNIQYNPFLIGAVDLSFRKSKEISEWCENYSKIIKK